MRAKTKKARLRCTLCGENVTVLPPELSPYKRYRIEVLETAVALSEEDTPKARVSARLYGVSPERIGVWMAQWRALSPLVIVFVEALLVADALSRRPIWIPGMTDSAYLRQLLGLAFGASAFIEVNRLLTGHGPKGKPPLLLAPP